MQNNAALDHYAGAQARSRQNYLLRARPPFAYVSKAWEQGSKEALSVPSFTPQAAGALRAQLMLLSHTKLALSHR